MEFVNQSINIWKLNILNNLIKTVEKTKRWNLKNLYIKEKCIDTIKIQMIETPVKNNIIKKFKIMIHKVLANNEKGAVFKARGYTDTIKAFGEYDGEIDNLVLAKKVLQKFGKKNPKKTMEKLKEILETGTLIAADNAIKNNLVLAAINLTTVYSIGYKKAIKLYNELGITTIGQLKAELQKNNSILHGKQKIGLKYYDDLNEKIPRSEMLEYKKILLESAKLIDPNIKLSINGSFRRKMPTSGDIDVLITCDGDTSIMRKKLINYLISKNIIVETLANGKKKFMGICKLSGFDKFRHIDIIDSSKECYPFGVLYFTGSGGFNAKMRGIALEKGFSLNEYQFSDRKTKIPISEKIIFNKLGKPSFEIERDIFTFLDMKYVNPEDRVNVTFSKI